MTHHAFKRIGIFSDIHGNLHALEAIMSALKEENLEQLFCCGDIVGYGANPNECIEMIRDLNCPVVVGNHDYAALGLANIEYFNEVAREAISWTSKVLTKDNRKYLKTLPFTHTEETFLFVHASPRAPEEWNYIINMGQAELNFHYFEQQICFIGHSHQPFIVGMRNGVLSRLGPVSTEIVEDTRYLINVGSVGQPRDRDPRACYAICDMNEKVVHIKRVDYDVEGAQNAILDNNLPRELAERLAYGW